MILKLKQKLKVGDQIDSFVEYLEMSAAESFWESSVDLALLFCIHRQYTISKIDKREKNKDIYISSSGNLKRSLYSLASK